MPYTINGSSASISTEPQLKDGTLWVPLRDVAQEMGDKVDYEPTNGVALLYHGSDIITIKIDDPNVDVSGTSHTLQAAPYVENGDTWVPVRFFNTALGAGVNVDLQNNSVDITSAAAGSSAPSAPSADSSGGDPADASSA